MNPIQILMSEHRVIEQVLDCLDAMSARVEQDGRLDDRSARGAIDFFRTFADRCHHGKEEDQLFPMMESRGFSPEAGPTAVMRAEHVAGRNWIAQMERAIPGAALGVEADRRAWIESARGYSRLLRAHIDKEDQCLFPMAEQALTEIDRTELGRQFDRVEHEDLGPGIHEKYLALADELADRFGIAKDRLPADAPRCGCSGHRP